MHNRVPVSKPKLWQNELKYVTEALKAGWISSRGSFIDMFEQKFAEFHSRKHAVAVTNGTAALHLALDILGVGDHDEVIVPDFSMISPILAVLYCGAVPVPVDVDSTWNIDPFLIEKSVTKHTRAVIAVHTYGHPAHMPRICEIAHKYGLYVIEDAAEAIGASIDGRLAGTFSEVACFSFYANKTITTGEGGMLLTDSDELASKARWKRDICFGKINEDRFIHKEIGYNYRFTNIQAAIGVAQMEHINEAIETKITIGRFYTDTLKGITGLTLPPEKPWAKNVFWMYGIVVEPEFGLSRLELQKRLQEAGIETRRFFEPVHSQPIIRLPVKKGEYPQTEHLAENGIYLPSYIGLLEKDIIRISGIIKAYSGKYTARS